MKNFSWGLMLAVIVSAGVRAWPQSQQQSQPFKRPDSQAAGNVKFEISSIRPTPDGSNSGMSIRVNPDCSVYASGAIVKALIMYAYDVPYFAISQGPDWINSEQYEIVAKGLTISSPDSLTPPDCTTRQGEILLEQIRPALQSLLAERFGLRVHHETKELPLYELTIAKGGTRLRQAADDEEMVGISPTVENDMVTWKGQKVSADSLAMALSFKTGRTVLNKTGLAGMYDFILQFARERGQGDQAPGASTTSNSAAVLDDSMAPSLFTALREQLGLSLESKKGPLPVLIIDRIEKPTPN